MERGRILPAPYFWEELMQAVTYKKYLPYVVTALLLAAVGLTLVSGIYPDEIATRMKLERYFITGGFRQGLRPFCPDGFLIAPPILLLPAATLWAGLTWLGSGWLSYRLVPYLGLAVIFFVLIHHNRKKGNNSFWPLLLFVTFGTTLFGITMLRPEILILMSCMGLYFLGSRMLSARGTSGLYFAAALSLLLYSIISFVHPKAIYLVAVPAAAIILSAPHIALPRYRYLYVTIFVIGLVLVTAAAVKLFQKELFFCPNVPSIEKTQGLQSVNLLDMYSNPRQFLEELRLAFGTTALKHTFRMFYLGVYEGNFLPDGPASVYDWFFNIFIGLAWVGFGIYGLTKYMRCFLKITDPMERKELYLITAVVLALSIPFALNITKHFYEVASFGFALMIMVTLLWPLNPAPEGPRPAMFLIGAQVGLIALSFACLLLSFLHFFRPLHGGYRGPDIPYDVDRTVLNPTLENMLASARIASGEPLVVSDLTYDALKFHPYVMPVTYAGYALDTPGAVQFGMRKFGFQYGLVECSLLPPLGQEFPVVVMKTLHHVQARARGESMAFDVCLFKMNFGETAALPVAPAIRPRDEQQKAK